MDFRKKKMRRRFGRRKVCRFCADKSLVIDYKSPQVLRYFITELATKLFDRRVRVLHHVMKQSGGQGRRVHVLLGQDKRYFETVLDIRLA